MILIKRIIFVEGKRKNIKEMGMGLMIASPKSSLLYKFKKNGATIVYYSQEFLFIRNLVIFFYYKILNI